MDRDVAQVFASHPSRASLERLIPVIEECQPILEAQGMDAVQQRLVDTGVAIVAAIAVTRGLLGWDNTPLAEARDIVCGSPARNTPPATESPRPPRHTPPATPDGGFVLPGRRGACALGAAQPGPMTTQPPPSQDVPVYVSPLDLTSYARMVQVCRLDGTITHPRACSTTAEFEAFANEERPGVDLRPEAGQVYWANDSDGIWPRDPT